MKIYTLGQVAKLLDIPERSIRRAEKAGRLPEPRRDERDHRIYTDDDVKIVRAHFAP